MTEEQIKIELRKINKGEDWNSLFNYIMLLEQDIRNLIAQRDEREKETIKLKKDIIKATTNWNELKKFVEEEKNRLAIQVSNTYEDSLGKRRFVNEDIFNELAKVSGKMQEMEGK